MDIFVTEQERRAAISKARSLRKLRAELARDSADAFCAYVLRDEMTDRPIRQAPVHSRWHRILDQERRVLFWSHVEAGKSSQVAVGRTLWELGRNPSLRIVIVSRNAGLAMKLVAQCARYIEKSPQVKQVFPKLRPTTDSRLPWRNNAITVEREGIGGRDPSIAAAGVQGSIIGSRVDLLVLDDILDYYNTRTKTQRDEVAAWVYSSLFTRLTAGARVWIIGNAWDADDVMHRLEREGGFAAYRFPVVDATGEVTWPARFTQDRIEQFKRDLTPLEYARQLMCQTRNDDESRFKQEWIDLCMANGDGKGLVARIEQADLREVSADTDEAMEELGVDTIEELREAEETIWRLTGEVHGQVIHGVDLAVSKSDAADLTAVVSLFAHRNGKRQVLSIQSGRWTAPEILARIKDTHQRFGGTFMVEDNAAQRYIVQLLQAGSRVPVIGVTTGRQKAHPAYGIEGMAVELAAGRWIIPSMQGKAEPEVADWISEMLFYDPRAHTGDRLMASWFAREGCRRLADPVDLSAKVGVRTF
jgi:hypothetical protein